MNRLIIFSAGLILSITSCKKEVKKVDGFLINASIDASANNKKATIFKMENRQRVVIATDTVKDGKIEFTGKVDIPDSYFISVDGVRGTLPFILENTIMDIAIYKDSIYKSKIKGSKENDLTTEYQNYALKMRKANQKLSERYKKAQNDKDNLAVSQVRATYDSLRKARNNFDINFVKNNNNTVIGALTLQQLLRSKSITLKDAESIFNTFNDTIKRSKAGIGIKQQIVAEKATEIGSIAPNFTGKTPDGKELSLNDIKSKITIIDFWASWCGPCRKENPNVVKLYKKYHKKGLEIIGVSLDRSAQEKNWKDAIKKDKLTWPQISNLKGWGDPIAAQYNVRSIPRTFILDASGKIIYKNLRGEHLERKIAELLK